MKAAKIPAPEPAKNASQVAGVQANSRGRQLGSEHYEAMWEDRTANMALPKISWESSITFSRLRDTVTRLHRIP